MKRTLLIVLIFISCYTTYGQTKSTLNSTIVIGKNLITNKVITATEYNFLDNIHHADMDTTSKCLTIQLREITKNGKNYKSKGEVLVFDLRTKKIKWSKEIDFQQTGLEQYENILFHTGPVNAVLMDMETGKSKWSTDRTIHATIPAVNISLGYKYNTSYYLNGIDLTNGKTIWKRTIDKSYGWNGILNLNDTAVIIKACGLHQINLKTGKGWDYDAQTGMKDYSKTIGLNIAGVALGLLTGYYVVSTGHDLMSNLVSNIVVDSGFYYYASKDYIVRLNQNGKILWKAALPKETGTTKISVKDSTVYLINYGTANYNGKVINYGKSYLSAFDCKSGIQRYLTTIELKDNPIESYIFNMDTLNLIFKDQVISYSLTNGSLLNTKIFDILKFGSIKYTVNENNIFLQVDSVFKSLHALDQKALYVMSTNDKIYKLNQSFELSERIPLDSIYSGTLETDKIRLINRKNQTVVLDKNNRKIGEMNLGRKLYKSDSKLYGFTDNCIIEVDLDQLK